jgi:hypothetical protein
MKCVCCGMESEEVICEDCIRDAEEAELEFSEDTKW